MHWQYVHPKNVSEPFINYVFIVYLNKIMVYGKTFGKAYGASEASVPSLASNELCIKKQFVHQDVTCFGNVIKGGYITMDWCKVLGF